MKVVGDTLTGRSSSRLRLQDCQLSVIHNLRGLVILTNLGGQTGSGGVISRFEFMKFQLFRDGHQDSRYVLLIMQYWKVRIGEQMESDGSKDS